MYVSINFIRRKQFLYKLAFTLMKFLNIPSTVDVSNPGAFSRLCSDAVTCLKLVYDLPRWSLKVLLPLYTLLTFSANFKYEL